MPGKKLSELGLTPRSGQGALIEGVSADSREVGPGYLFAALPGSAVHGGQFIARAIEQGAAAILTDQEGVEIAGQIPAPLVLSEEPRAAFARAASLFFGPHPSTMVAVTGTNGKTSVASFTRQIWQVLGHAAVNLGTTGYEGDWQAPLAHTTPDPVSLHRTLAGARAAGITHAAMEASSHGLDQRRLDGVRLMAAGFTNFTQDHLDYHKSFEAYFDAKASLFARVLPDDGTAVINIDDARGPDMAAIASARGQKVITVGRGGGDLQITAQRMDNTGQEIRLSYQGKPYHTRLNLIGDFQGENVMVAAGLVIACGGSASDVFAALPHLRTVRGRMQLSATRANGAAVYVDYAHTPDAVETALHALRPHVMGRIVVVLGAGGDRDAGKRPLMGQAAARGADLVYVTDDNPRSEDPALIRAAVLEGCPGAIEVGDRAEAILRAVAELEAGDALLIAGKGHEGGQIIGTDVLPFDDAEQASISVAALEGGTP